MKALGNTLLFVYAIALSLSADGQEPKKVDDAVGIHKKILGSYRLKAGKSDGDDLPTDKIAEVTVKITDQTITTYDRDKQQQYSASYKMNTDEKPWKILMTAIPKKPSDPSAGGKAADVPALSTQGLIELSEDGRKLKIVYALPGGEAPKDFKGGKRLNLFELERLQ